MDTVREAYEVGYQFALVRPNSKAGIGSWNREEHSLPCVLRHLERGGNVAIKLAETRQQVKLCVIDIDSKSSRLMRLARRHGYESEQEVVTASGKRHIWGKLAEGTETRTRIKPLGLGLDVKVSGIVLWPPSRIGGGVYRLPRGRRIVAPDALPVFDLTPILGQPVEKQKLQPPMIDMRIESVRRYIRKIVAVSGQGGHNATYRAACKLADAGLSEEQVLQELLAWQEDGCAVPIWDIRELEHKARDAVRRPFQR